MAVDVDTVLLNLNEKGFYQIAQFVATCISMIPVAVSLLKIVFIGFVPKSKCAELNITQLYQYGYENNETHDIQYEACRIHISSLTGDGTNHTLSCINGYSYEENSDLSLVSEWKTSECNLFMEVEIATLRFCVGAFGRKLKTWLRH
ncbi:uncharacterized protein LOC106867568 [Octopus bimaculoides]|uniref:uncharacterized protein LOC106867568 n=1 Tax=Octopus bimaculoides TaxID=37653 RepID=UPI0022E51DE1|nr:uncharacterized protein LOC106867568 [Octopus bimaculoides]